LQATLNVSPALQAQRKKRSKDGGAAHQEHQVRSNSHGQQTSTGDGKAPKRARRKSGASPTEVAQITKRGKTSDNAKSTIPRIPHSMFPAVSNLETNSSAFVQLPAKQFVNSPPLAAGVSFAAPAAAKLRDEKVATSKTRGQSGRTRKSRVASPCLSGGSGARPRIDSPVMVSPLHPGGNNAGTHAIEVKKVPQSAQKSGIHVQCRPISTEMLSGGSLPQRVEVTPDEAKPAPLAFNTDSHSKLMSMVNATCMGDNRMVASPHIMNQVLSPREDSPGVAMVDTAGWPGRWKPGATPPSNSTSRVMIDYKGGGSLASLGGQVATSSPVTPAMMKPPVTVKSFSPKLIATPSTGGGLSQITLPSSSSGGSNAISSPMLSSPPVMGSMPPPISPLQGLVHSAVAGVHLANLYGNIRYSPIGRGGNTPISVSPMPATSPRPHSAANSQQRPYSSSPLIVQGGPPRNGRLSASPIVSYVSYLPPPMTPEGEYIPVAGEDRERCNCAKTKCNTKRCKCFREGRKCIGCNCCNCENQPGSSEHQAEHQAGPPQIQLNMQNFQNMQQRPGLNVTQTMFPKLPVGNSPSPRPASLPAVRSDSV